MELHENSADRAARQRACRLADTGRFAIPREVEEAMIAEGWPNARRVMHGDYISLLIAERCRLARNPAMA